MQRRTIPLIALASIPFILAGCATATEPEAHEPTDVPAVSCGPIAFATIDDDAHRVGWYALSNNLIESEILTDFSVDYLALPALVQATGTGQYQMMQTSLAAVPRARANAGLDLRFIALGSGYGESGPVALFTREASGISSVEDLAGKTVGTTAFTAISTMEAQFVFAEEHGLNSALEGGDIRWVELDPPTLLNAVKRGDVDAAVLFYQAGWQAENDAELVKVAEINTAYSELLDGAIPFGSAIVAENEYIEENRECVAEFQRMAAESAEYAEQNYSDFAGKIAELTGADPEYIDYYWNQDEKNYLFYGGLEDDWVDSAQTFYDAMTEHGQYPEALNVEELAVR
jgi:ABC-type nitrate/sulfonate/bicarbonate transport system substrate-binding protein